MPTLRLRHLIRQPRQYVVEEKYKKRWTFVEKKKLLAGLKRSALCTVSVMYSIESVFVMKICSKDLST